MILQFIRSLLLLTELFPTLSLCEAGTKREIIIQELSSILFEVIVGERCQTIWPMILK